ncbi:MAG: MotA/TolQ/ExbB proton channel family protein [Bacteroidota bacterium]
MLRELLVKGGFVMYPLLFCSVTALAVTLERAFFFLRLRRLESGTRERLKAFHQLRSAGDLAKAALLLKESDGPTVRVILAGLAADDPQAARRLMRDNAAVERRRLFAGLAILDTVVTAAPLLGLLGTVTGILHTFNVLGGDPAARSMQAVGNGIAEALITTAAGLVIAIPALVALNYYIHCAETTNEALEREVANLEWGDASGQVLDTQGQH